MTNYEQLKADIAAVVRANGIEAITGDRLQQVLTHMVDVLGNDYALAGVATPTTNPPTPDGNTAYIAGTSGTYTYFLDGNYNPLVVPSNCLTALLMYDASAEAWTAYPFGTIAQGTIGTNELADGAVTTPKIANSAVTTPKINDGAVSEAKLATAVQNKINNAVTLDGAETITGSKEFTQTVALNGGAASDNDLDLEAADNVSIRANGGTMELSADDDMNINAHRLDINNPTGIDGDLSVIGDINATGDIKATGKVYANINDELATKSYTDAQLATKQDSIADLSTIRAGAALGATAYQKPSGGIPESDLSASVQASLGKADTALQDIPDGSVTLAKIASAAIDATPTMNSNKLVESGGVYSQLTSGDFVFINQNSATLPNFDNSTRKLDLGADPVIYCDGVRYQPAVIWSSDTTKFRAIEWLPVGTVAAQMLVFNRQTCEFAFKSWSYTPANYEKIVGGIRINSAGILSANVPFWHTINGVPEPIPQTIANGLRVSLIFTNLSTGIVPPNVNTTTHIMTLGSDTGVEIGNTHYGTNNASVDLKPTNTTAFKLWFKTTNKTFYARTYSSQPDANSVLVGAYRWGGADVYLDFPFEVTFNGDPHSLGKYYNYSNLNAAPVVGEPILLPSSAKKVTAIAYSQYGTMSYTGAQGFTIAENRFIIQGYNGGKLAIIDMREKSIKGQFLLASTGTDNHCNAISCGARYAASDVLPLLYISEAYGTYRLFVERVASDFGSSTLVQTITFTGTMPANHNGNSFAVDTYGNKLYMCVHTSDHNVQVYEFALPNPTGGDVTLTDADILTTFTVNGIDNIMQGVEYYNGRLYMPFGYGSASYPNEFHVIDITQQKVVSSIYLQGMLATEPEDCSFYGGMLAISRTTNTFDLYTFD